MSARVLLLDDDVDLRMVVTQFVGLLCGGECVTVGSFEELVAARDTALGCSVALLDVNLGAGRPTGIDAYRWLRGQGFAGKLYFFTGHARSHPQLAELTRMDGIEVLPKPLDADKLLEVLRCPTVPATPS
jgi:DNA-binding NtrC family response regulator